jgi:hypothetical protein
MAVLDVICDVLKIVLMFLVWFGFGLGLTV